MTGSHQADRQSLQQSALVCLLHNQQSCEAVQDSSDAPCDVNLAGMVPAQACWSFGGYPIPGQWFM